MYRRLDAYVVGAANAGKSSFINHVLRRSGPRAKGGKPGSGKGGKSEAKPRELTTSHLPGTTLDFVRVGVAGGRSIYDTPGIVLPNQLTTLLSTDELASAVPKKRAQHVTLRLGEGKAALLSGLAQVHMISGPSDPS